MLSFPSVVLSLLFRPSRAESIPLLPRGTGAHPLSLRAGTDAKTSSRRRAFSANQVTSHEPLRKEPTASDPGSSLLRNPLRKAHLQDLQQLSPEPCPLDFQVGAPPRGSACGWGQPAAPGTSQVWKGRSPGHASPAGCTLCQGVPQACRKRGQDPAPCFCLLSFSLPICTLATPYKLCLGRIHALQGPRISPKADSPASPGSCSPCRVLGWHPDTCGAAHCIQQRVKGGSPRTASGCSLEGWGRVFSPPQHRRSAQLRNQGREDVQQLLLPHFCSHGNTGRDGWAATRLQLALGRRGSAGGCRG